MKPILTTLAAIAVGSAVVASAAPAAHTARTSASSSISVRRTPLGKILVDGKGRTLYLFERDRANKSNCSSSCLTVWPALTAPGKPRAGGGAIGSKVGTIRRADGLRQVTYAKHPLYYYAGDRRAGDTNGQGLNQFGATWYVLSRAGRKIDND